MQKTLKKEHLKTIVCKGLAQLLDLSGYGQSDVVNKLKMLSCPISTASLSNIKNDKAVGLPTLRLAAKGIQALLQQELDMAFDEEEKDFRPQNTPNWVASIVPEKPSRSQDGASFKLHVDGRVSIQQKTEFIADARQEVIEVGVRLNSFANYFISQNEQAYKSYILELLQRGINIKGYLLDPNSSEALLYFSDRAKVQSFEKDSIGDIKKVIERLRSLRAEFEALQLPGKFDIFLYKHIPYSLFLVVDGSEESGKMMVSPYLYGVRRANCPVMEFNKKDQRSLYRKYWESLQLFLDGAQKLT
ncbi:MAG: hypothetical protein ACKVUS_22370 [Saprospiraceae bacterium]